MKGLVVCKSFDVNSCLSVKLLPKLFFTFKDNFCHILWHLQCKKTNKRVMLPTYCFWLSEFFGLHLNQLSWFTCGLWNTTGWFLPMGGS